MNGHRTCFWWERESASCAQNSVMIITINCRSLDPSDSVIDIDFGLFREWEPTSEFALNFNYASKGEREEEREKFA